MTTFEEGTVESNVTGLRELLRDITFALVPMCLFFYPCLFPCRKEKRKAREGS